MGEEDKHTGIPARIALGLCVAATRRAQPVHRMQLMFLRPSAPRDRDERGFTLIEIIVVLAIIAIASAVLMPAMRTGLSGIRLEAKGRDLATLCRMARTMAVGEQHVYRIGLERHTNSVFLADTYHEKLRDFDLTEEIEIDSIKYEGKEAAEDTVFLSFYPNGRADDVEIVLKNRGGRRIVLRTDILTGAARISLGREQP
jgi:general secretion pathway protein H